MKYIRTKDEIIKIENEWEYASCGGITVYNENEDLYIADDDIIKTADTIEELCDEFVIDDGLTKPTTHNSYNDILEIIDECNKYGDYIEVYAAIWTEWGLKYVAKMNEKGELELL